MFRSFSLPSLDLDGYQLLQLMLQFDKMCSNQTNPMIDVSDADTQSLSSPPSSFSGRDEMEDGETVPLPGETQMLDLDEETQILEYPDDADDQIATTQLVDEGSDKTQVLSDGDDDGMYVGKDYVLDSDVSTDTDDRPSALSRASGQSSSQMKTPMATNYEKSYVPNNPACVEWQPDKDDGMDLPKDSTSVGIEGPEEAEESPAHDHQFAGLSYVGSQEPGEFSQANALSVVDRYLTVNHVDFSQEKECAKKLNGLDPLVSRPKGTQILAKSSGIKSPVTDVAIYDWVDSCEDGGCRDNSTNTRIGSQEHRSLTRTREFRYLHRKEGVLANKSGEDSNLHQKLSHSTCSDMRELCNSGQNANMLQTSEAGILKKSSNTLYEKLITESFENSLEEVGRMNLPDAYDIGFDTQMAAEAMEALCYADPPNQDTDNFCQISEKVNCGSPRVVTNSEALTKRVYVRKRVSPDSGASGGRSRRRRKLVKEVDYVNSDLSAKGLKTLPRMEPIHEQSVTRKPKAVNSKAGERQTNGISFDGENDKWRRPSKSAQRRNKSGTLENLRSKNSKRHDGKKMSNNNLGGSESRVQEDFRTFTPIACRTRRSKAAKPLTGSVLLSCDDVANGKVEASLSMDKTIRYCSGVDDPASRKHKVDSLRIAKIGNNELIQLEPPGIGKILEETTKNEKSDFQSHSKVIRKCQNFSSILNGASILASGEDSCEQYIPRRKRSKIGGRNSLRAKPPRVWGSKFDTTIHLFSDGVKRNDMSKATAEDKIKSSNRSSISNRTNTTETPSPIFLGLKNTSEKAASVPPIEESRKIRVLADVRLLLSHHLDDNIIKQQEKISSRLGLAIVSSLSEATHFIADKFVRTRNMLEAIAFGKPVVTHLWLESCRKANSFVDETNYILRDFEKEKEFGFSMPVSLARARACGSQLLQGKRIFVTPHVKPSRELVASLATTVLGQVVKKIGRSEMNGDTLSDDFLVLSCEEDYAICLPLLLKRAAVYSAELILSGIIIQKLEYERHQLFGDHITRSGRVKGTPRG